MNHPIVRVGIMSAKEIDFTLHGFFNCNRLSRKVTGAQRFVCKNGMIFDPATGNSFPDIHFSPESASDHFELHRVTIGIDFHWERTESQCFRGALDIIVDGDLPVVINTVDIEQYLQSVISSEMSAAASLEFLKVHAVISRSWLLAQTEKRDKSAKAKPVSCMRSDTELIQWFDREDHRLFDVCADDHCQRYQGITRIVSPTVKEATEATCGMVLTYENEICDTRFSKCCGGMTEAFENAWEPHPHPYLTKVRDSRQCEEIDLSDEDRARAWILGSPPAFCNTADKSILEQVLNNYDRETPSFYRWTVTYSQDELSELIRQRSDIDFGQIVDLVPVQRGVSGRIVKLRIEGTKRTMTVGKELLIRRFLSPSHLYSSAFVAEKEPGEGGIPRSFVLRGAGWGHGVGLCQIGAAVMCAEGYDHRRVLEHYYPGSRIEQRYKK